MTGTGTTNIAIVIPSTFGAEERDPKLKVFKIGTLIRAISIFGAGSITIYRDYDPKIDDDKNASFLVRYLRYAECPPYLRKELIPKDKELRYANILPALQIGSHGYDPEYREGVVKKVENQICTVNAGLSQPILLNTTEKIKPGDRVTLRKLRKNRGDKKKGGWILSAKKPEFWNISIAYTKKGLKKTIDKLREKGYFILGTSVKGDEIKRDSLKKIDLQKLAIIFGSAWRGLYDIMDKENFNTSHFDAIWRTIPIQFTKTVRTEEAVMLSLYGIVTLRTFC